MRFIQQNAWAPNTVKAISSEWKAFREFCLLASIYWLPVAPYVICFFAVWLISSGRVKTRGSLAQYISAVRTVHVAYDFPEIPTPSQYGPLDMILKGTRRLAMHRTKKSLPVTPSILRNLLLSTIPSHHASFYQHTIHIFRVLSLIYYLTMLRSSNLIAKSMATLDLDMTLCWEDISPLNGDVGSGILIKVAKSKNNQFGERDHLIPLAAADDPLLCPVKAILSLVPIFGKAHCAGRVPVFQVPDGFGGFTMVLRHKFNSWFSTRLAKMGLDKSLYTLHAFRHGGIQECLLAESNYALCRLTSDHSSDAILEYAHVPPERRLQISKKVNDLSLIHI